MNKTSQTSKTSTSDAASSDTLNNSDEINKLFLSFALHLINNNDKEDTHSCRCDVCGRINFDGYRYKCLKCDDYDLCGSCFENKKTNKTHQIKHPVARLEKPLEVCGIKLDITELNLRNLAEKFKNNIHQRTTCDSCDSCPIRGLRFKCDQCNDYDLCLACFVNEKTSLNHHADHPMIVFISNQRLDISPNNIELLDKLGEGAFGKVYKAKIKNSNELVACKVIEITKSQIPLMLLLGLNPENLYKSYIQELEAYRELKGENILKMIGHSFEQTDDSLKMMLITEFMAKGSLTNVLNSESNISYRKRLKIACDIAAGMTRIHERGFIHRDIRPDNILLATDYTAKIGDMGISKFIPSNSSKMN